MTWTCAHCGLPCGDYDGGYATVTFDGGEPVHVCHPNDPTRPDCMRRLSVYREPLGALIGVDPKPAGLEGISEQQSVIADLSELGQELAARMEAHSPRPAGD